MRSSPAAFVLYSGRVGREPRGVRQGGIGVDRFRRGGACRRWTACALGRESLAFFSWEWPGRRVHLQSAAESARLLVPGRPHPLLVCFGSVKTKSATIRYLFEFNLGEACEQHSPFGRGQLLHQVCTDKNNGGSGRKHHFNPRVAPRLSCPKCLRWLGDGWAIWQKWRYL